MLIAPGIFFRVFLQSLLDEPYSTYNCYCFFLIAHFLVVSISKSLYLESFSIVFNEVFISDGTAISTSWLVLFLWCLITIRLCFCINFHIFSTRCQTISWFDNHRIDVRVEERLPTGKAQWMFRCNVGFLFIRPLIHSFMYLFIQIDLTLSLIILLILCLPEK